MSTTAEAPDQIVIALENAYQTLYMLKAVPTMEGSWESSELHPLIERVEKQLIASYSEKQMDDSAELEVLRKASAAARKVWNPVSADNVHRLAIKFVNDAANAEAQQYFKANSAAYTGNLIKPMAPDIRHAYQALIDFYPGTNRDHKAIAAGLEAGKRLSQLKEKYLPGLGIDNVNMPLPRLTLGEHATGSVFRIWAGSCGKASVWPELDTLKLLLEQVEGEESVSGTTFEETLSLWRAERPDLPPAWIQHATEALKYAGCVSIEPDGQGRSPAQQIAIAISDSLPEDDHKKELYSEFAVTISPTATLQKHIDQVCSVRDKVLVAAAALEELLQEAGDITVPVLELTSGQAQMLQRRLVAEMKNLSTTVEEVSERLDRASVDSDQRQSMRLG